MKCRVCRQPAVIDIRRHNANFCQEHFVRYCHQQVKRAVDEFDMLNADDRVLVAVSGGKDSLAVWDMLVDTGWRADGLYVGLGIGTYSDHSLEATRRFAEARDLNLVEVDLRDRYGYDVPTAAAVTGRVPCSACGISKRHIFDRAAIDGGYDVVVTGHNLDDEAAVLFGNVMRWQIPYLARQQPCLPAGEGFPRKVKPLVRLSERETAAYCVIRGIDYLVDECPMAKGNRHLAFKETLNAMELQSPGTKAAFYLGFLQRGTELFHDGGDGYERGQLSPCRSCGAPTDNETCAFCRIVDRCGGQERATPGPVSVELATGEQ